MILTCDHCQTRYSLPTGLLGPDGRRVRCSHCGHEWYQDPPEDKTFAQAMESVEPIPDSVKPDHQREEPVIHILPAIEEDTAPRKGGNGLAGYAMAACVMLVASGFGFVFSGAVVKMWPPSLAVYELVHMAPVLPGEGLAVDRVTAEVVTGTNGMNILKVAGFATNLTAEAIGLPSLRVTLLRKGGEVIDTWLVDPGKDSLGREEEVKFATTYPTPPTDAHEVNVRLEPFGTVRQLDKDMHAAEEKEHVPAKDGHAKEEHAKEEHAKEEHAKEEHAKEEHKAPRAPAPAPHH